MPSTRASYWLVLALCGCVSGLPGQDSGEQAQAPVGAHDDAMEPAAASSLGSRSRPNAFARSDGGASEAMTVSTASAAQLDALVAAYRGSVQRECACYWAAAGFDYASEDDCLETAALDDEGERCYLDVLSTATAQQAACKLEVEAELHACISERCGERDELDCLRIWTRDDERCAPAIASDFYAQCI